jgi:hypothetical protein
VYHFTPGSMGDPSSVEEGIYLSCVKVFHILEEIFKIEGESTVATMRQTWR